MEVYVFMITVGGLLAAAFVMIGVIIGEINANYHQKHNKDSREDVRDDDSDHDLLHSGACDGRDSPLGDVHGEEPRGYAHRYLHKLTGEDLAAFMRLYMHTSVHMTPGEIDYFYEIIERLEGDYEDHD